MFSEDVKQQYNNNNILSDPDTLVCTRLIKYCLNQHSAKVLATPICNSIVAVAMVTDLWCHLTYNSRGAWHTVYAMLPSNYKWDAT